MLVFKRATGACFESPCAVKIPSLKGTKRGDSPEADAPERKNSRLNRALSTNLNTKAPASPLKGVGLPAIAAVIAVAIISLSGCATVREQPSGAGSQKAVAASYTTFGEKLGLPASAYGHTSPLKISAGTRPFALAHQPAEPSKATASFLFIRPKLGQDQPEITANIRQLRGWAIAPLSGDHTLLDDRANPRLVSRLLDGMVTLEIQGAAPLRTQDPKLLAQYGLDRPRDALRWVLVDQKVNELFLGLPHPKRPDLRFARIPQLDPEGVYLVGGPVLSLIAKIKGFDDFRERNLLTWDPDRIDDLLIKDEQSTPCFAERQGDRWSSKSNPNLTTATENYLDAWVKTEIRRFVDDPKEAETLKREIEKHPSHQIIARDREGTPLKVSLARVKSRGEIKWMGSASNRGIAVFEIADTDASLVRRASQEFPKPQLQNRSQ